VRFLLLFTFCASASLAPAAQFTEHLIAGDLKGGYQVVVADINHDGKPDILALASGMTELVWYENPTWERHVIAGGLAHMINLAAFDYDGDGVPEIVLATEFANEASKSIGIVSVLHHNGDPRQPWSVKEIDRIPTSHRLRWADIAGDGKKVLINAPLTGLKAAPPDYTGRAPLVFYRPGDWKRQEIPSLNEGVQHGIFIVDWDGNGRDDILSASFSGIDLFRYTASGQWTRTEIAHGDPAPSPKSGSSDVTVGKLGKERILAAIEPWHGNQVVVYRQAGKLWQRTVIDDSLLDGHTILTADFNGTGKDQIVAGFRQGSKSLFLYQINEAGTWTKQVIDKGGMPAASCAAADLNGDGRPDIVCIGATVLKWYENH
jgi:FG-GAP-like repeat